MLFDSSMFPILDLGSKASALDGYQTDAELQDDLASVYSFSNFGGCMMWNAATATSTALVN